MQQVLHGRRSHVGPAAASLWVLLSCLPKHNDHTHGGQDCEALGPSKAAEEVKVQLLAPGWGVMLDGTILLMSQV